MLKYLRRVPCVGLLIWTTVIAVGPVVWLHVLHHELPLGSQVVIGDRDSGRGVSSFAPDAPHATHCVFCAILRSSQPGKPVASVAAVAALPAVALVQGPRPVGPVLAPSPGRSPPA